MSHDLMTQERQGRIVRLVNTRGHVTVAELTEQFGVSEATIRRDLSTLASDNLLRRAHGGALRLGKVVTSENPLLQRQAEHTAEKARIGSATAGLIADGESLLLVGGSTGLAVAQCLGEHKNLTIITESLPVAQELLQQGQHHLIILGGVVDPDEQATRGALARQMLAQIRVDKAIIGARAVSVKHGISAETPEEAEFFRAFFAHSEQVILVVDSSKFHLSALIQVAPLGIVTTLITDENLDEVESQQIIDMGVQLLRV